jgi:hypothetical protein
MEIGHIGFHRRAFMTLGSLSDAEQAKVFVPPFRVPSRTTA